MRTIFPDAFRLLFPRSCLVCQRPVHVAWCSRCRPAPITLAETRCEACFEPIAEMSPGALCALCRSLPLPLRQVRFLWRYEELARSCITRMKYLPSMRLCHEVAKYAAHEVPELFRQHDWDCVVAIPSSSRSRRRRGFNQCQNIAATIAHYLGIHCRSDVLVHCGYPAPQVSVRHTLRFENVAMAFKTSKSPNGKSILLVDDVITTGATSLAATKALLDAGAYAVDLFALARAHQWNEFRALPQQRLKER